MKFNNNVIYVLRWAHKHATIEDGSKEFVYLTQAVEEAATLGPDYSYYIDCVTTNTIVNHEYKEPECLKSLK